MNDECRHKWECLSGTKVICNSCNTVVEISDLVAITQAATATETKVKVLADQLFAHALKKDAHEKAYAWVMQHRPAAMNQPQQGALL